MFASFFPKPNKRSTNLNLNQHNYEDIKKIIDENRVKYQLPGVQVSFIFSGNDPIDFVCGTTTLNGTTSVTTDTLFRIGSITKSFTAVTLLKLEAEGLLNLNDTLKKWFPQVVPAWENITIKQLLNHTSGIADYTHKVYDWGKQWTLDELVNAVINEPLSFSPGTGWEYCNTNYILASMIIRAVTGESTEKVINDRILKPLQLSNTYFLPRSCDDDILQRMAHGYASEINNYPTLPIDVTNYNLSYGDAAFAMISTSHDVAIWLRELINGSLLPAKQQKELMKTVGSDGQTILKGDKKGGYGLGIQHNSSTFGEESWFHGGRIPGCRSYMIWLKNTDLIITTIINASVDKDNPLLISDLVSFIQKLEKTNKSKANILDESNMANIPKPGLIA